MLDCLYPKELLERNRDIRRKTGFFILTCRMCCRVCFTPPAPHHSPRLHIYHPLRPPPLLDLNRANVSYIGRERRGLPRARALPRAQGDRGGGYLQRVRGDGLAGGGQWEPGQREGAGDGGRRPVRGDGAGRRLQHRQVAPLRPALARRLGLRRLVQLRIQPGDEATLLAVPISFLYMAS